MREGTIRPGERGSALIVMLFLLTLLMGAGAAIHGGVLGETSLRGSHARNTTSFYAAEAGLNRGMGEFTNTFKDYNVPAGASFTEKTFSLGTRTVRYKMDPDPTNPQTGLVPAGQSFGGLQQIQYRYTAESRAEGANGDLEARLGSQFDVGYIPLFQFVAFFEGDLEIAPGPDMWLHGPIHTNGSLYLNAGNALTIEELPPTMPTMQVTAHGDIIRGRKDDPGVCQGTVRIAKLEDADSNGVLDLQDFPCSGPLSPAQQATWLGSIKAHQPLITIPSPDVVERGTGRFWQNSDLRIVLDLDNPDIFGRFPIVVHNAGGGVDAAKTLLLQQFMIAKPGRLFYTDDPKKGKLKASCLIGSSYCNPASYQPDFLSLAEVYACPGSDLGLYPGCAAYVTNQPLATGGVTARRGGFYNNRENQWSYLLNLNLHDFLEWNRTKVGPKLFDPLDTTHGGIVIFLSVKGPNSGGIPTTRYGARIFGSPRLVFPLMPDPTGVSVVTDHAMYIEGDYNTTAGGAVKQPAALMGDTINVLSANWSGSGACRNDCQSRQDLGARPLAVDTTINAAFLGGTETTSVGNYNGGLENYPRFHESWSGRTLLYRGSFVSLGNNIHANGAWCGTGGGCNIYNPPNRNWDFDQDFMNAANLPPMTPRIVSVRQTVFAEQFR